LLILAGSCGKENAFDCFKGNGSEKTEMRLPGNFDQIQIADNFEVHVYQAPQCKVEVICGKNVIGNIETSVSDGVLTVNNNNKCNFVRGYKRKVKLNIYLPYIKLLVNDNVGIATVDENFSQDSISVKVASSGDLHLNGTYRVIKTSSNSNGDMYIGGKASRLYVFTTGVNYVWAQELIVADYMFIHTVTMGDCYVNATGCKLLDYNIQKTGNIYYYGTPLSIGNHSDGGTGHLIAK
jgi:hypothetical protein